jgi:hypothetical protein
MSRMLDHANASGVVIYTNRCAGPCKRASDCGRQLPSP